MQSAAPMCHVINRPLHMLMLMSLSSRWHDIWDGGLQKGQVCASGPAVLQAAAFFLNSHSSCFAVDKSLLAGCC